MKKIGLLLSLMVWLSAATAQLADSLKEHIDTAIAILKNHSLYTRRVDWEAAKKEAYLEAANAKNKEQLFTAIAGVYRRLNDHHGMFVQYEDRLQLPDSSAIRRYSPALLREWVKGPAIRAEMLDDVAYLGIPGMPVYNQQQIDRYANWLADSLVSLAAKQPRAWILDLRLNSGGNITPMMAGLASFFGNGLLSCYLDRNRKSVSQSVIREGKFYIDDTVHANIRTSIPDLSHARVAVITGAGTGSSGEGVAAIFKDRKRTRLFGETTAGFANATEGFLFNDGNSYFLITTLALGNKKKRILPERVLPHKMIVNNDAFENLAGDHAVTAALRWLR